MAQNGIGKRTEFEFLKDLDQRFAVERFYFKMFVLELHLRHVGIDAGEPFRQNGFVGVVFHDFLLFAFEFVGVGEQVFHVVELGEQFGGGFFADTGQAGDVVDRVAHEREHVHHLVDALDAPFFTHFFYPPNFHVAARFAGFVHKNMFIHELAVVFVGGHHVHVVPFFFGLFGEGSDHIIGFVVVDDEHGDVHGLHDAVDPRNGESDVFGLRLAVGFVGIEFFVAERTSFRIEHHGEVGGFFVLHHIPQRAHKTLDGGHVPAFGIEQRTGDEGVMGAVNKRMAVEQEQFF